jgi:tetratricopeptide (TPR) repeat protein
MFRWLLVAVLAFPVAAAHAQDAGSTGLDPAIAPLVMDALKAEDEGRVDDAIALFEKVVEIAPKDVRAINALAGLHGLRGEFDAEVDWARRALAVDPGYGQAHVNLGNGEAGRGHFDAAVVAFTAATRIEDTRALGHYGLGLMSEQARDLAGAEKHYLDAVAADPGFANGHFNLAAVHANQGRFEEAKADLARVLALVPGDPDAKAMLAQIGAEAAKK